MSTPSFVRLDSDVGAGVYALSELGTHLFIGISGNQQVLGEIITLEGGEKGRGLRLNLGKESITLTDKDALARFGSGDYAVLVPGEVVVEDDEYLGQSPPPPPRWTLASSVKHHTESWTGHKKSNEDRHFSDLQLGHRGSLVGAYFGVYDGHGGQSTAEYVAKSLHRAVASAYLRRRQGVAGRTQANADDIAGALRDGFASTDRLWLDKCRGKGQHSGSTAIVAVVTGDSPDALTLHTANLGDCRAVLCRAGLAVRLSRDHKPNRLDERRRIEAAGGQVGQARGKGPWRVARGARFNSAADGGGAGSGLCLSVSRSFGDITLKEPTVLVSPVPELRSDKLGVEDLFLVLACDGVWDVLTDQRVVDLVLEAGVLPPRRRHPGVEREEAAKKKRGREQGREPEKAPAVRCAPENAAAAVARAALAAGSGDNITATVIMWADDARMEAAHQMLLQRKKDKEEEKQRRSGTGGGGGSSSSSSSAAAVVDMFA